MEPIFLGKIAFGLFVGSIVLAILGTIAKEAFQDKIAAVVLMLLGGLCGFLWVVVAVVAVGIWLFSQ